MPPLHNLLLILIINSSFLFCSKLRLRLISWLRFTKLWYHGLLVIIGKVPVKVWWISTLGNNLDLSFPSEYGLDWIETVLLKLLLTKVNHNVGLFYNCIFFTSVINDNIYTGFGRSNSIVFHDFCLIIWRWLIGGNLH